MHSVIVFLLLAPMLLASVSSAQPSSAPPTSLPVTPLSPAPTNRNGIGSCGLCRPLDGRPGSDLQRHRRTKDPHLHPHKKAPGMTKSLKRSFKNQLPHRKLDEHQEESDQQTGG